MSCKLQVGDYLSEMDGVDAIYGLQFDNEATFDQQIQFQLRSEPLATIVEADTAIAFHEKACSFQFESQALAINCLQQARSKRSMHFDCAADYFLSQCLNIVVMTSHAGRGEHKLRHQSCQAFSTDSQGSWQLPLSLHRLSDEEFTDCLIS